MIKVHHKKKEFCYKRAKYRESSWKRAVKVYTINQESKYLLVLGVPSVGASKELVELFALYGDIEEYRLLHEYPTEEFTEVYWIKYKKLPCARYGKNKLDNRSFFGGLLHVCYAPEYETVDDTREKLFERRRTVMRKSKEYQEDNKNENESEVKSLRIVNTQNSGCDINVSSSCDNNADSFPLTYPISTSLHPTTTPVIIDKTLPRIPTKNATLPIEIQNLSAQEVYPTYYNDINQKSVHNPRKTEEKFSSNCEKVATSQLTKSESKIGTKRKCINWNKPYTDPTTTSLNEATKNIYTSEPGAWYPFKVERKQEKTVEKDGVDITVNNIRNQLDKTSESTQEGTQSQENACPLQAVINTQIMEPRVIAKKKKTRW